METVRKSIRHMLRVVDQHIMRDPNSTTDAFSAIEGESPSAQTISRIPFNDATNHQWTNISIEDPAFSGNLVRFGDRYDDRTNRLESNLSFDILTSDLLHQFALYPEVEGPMRV
jgi:hypothetical protein